MTLTPDDWHQRFTQQARWTKDLRDYLYTQIEIEKAQRILEVGCGTGAVLADMPETIPNQVGLDIDRSNLNLAMRISTNTSFTQGDAHILPYTEACFDLTVCHFLLLWVVDPIQVIREMARVTRPGCSVLVLAEPDYGGRIDHPEELAVLGELQMQSLQKQGADPTMGRKLANLFHQAGLDAIVTGVLGGQWLGTPNWGVWESEWAVLESDFKKTSQVVENWDALKELDKSAYGNGERVLFVPTFYAWGRVPSSVR